MRYLILLLAFGCVQQRSARCKQVCAREYECVTSTSSSVPFDEKECIAACAVLEADPDNLAKVQNHADCVAKHTACNEVLECQ
ncbi:MAG: hypothetical protein QM831_19570 [Kofleriaceae bacterium]